MTMSSKENAACVYLRYATSKGHHAAILDVFARWKMRSRVLRVSYQLSLSACPSIRRAANGRNGLFSCLHLGEVSFNFTCGPAPRMTFRVFWLSVSKT